MADFQVATGRATALKERWNEVDLGIPTNTPFEVAYEQADKFSKLLQARTRAGGFMKSLMLQRICSSFASGLKTAQNMLQHSI